MAAPSVSLPDHHNLLKPANVTSARARPRNLRLCHRRGASNGRRRSRRGTISSQRGPDRLQFVVDRLKLPGDFVGIEPGPNQEALFVVLQHGYGLMKVSSWVKVIWISSSASSRRDSPTS